MLTEGIQVHTVTYWGFRDGSVFKPLDTLVEDPSSDLIAAHALGGLDLDLLGTQDLLLASVSTFTYV